MPDPTPRGVLISRDLMFTSKVTGTAQQLGLSVVVVPDGAAATRQIAASPVQCMFIDLSLPPWDLPAFIASLPSDGRPTIIAFGSHVATEKLQEARTAGCDEVLPRSRFSGELPALLIKHLGPMS
ncbi:MAG: response regulator [Planctomycetales bacterium]